MPIAVYQIVLSLFDDSTFDEISELIIAKINKKRKDGFWIEQPTANLPGGCNAKVFSSFKQTQPKWGKFILPILSATSLLVGCKNSIYSFLCFIQYENQIFAITGGNGSFAIDDFVSPSFGLDILVRLIKKDSQVIKSIQERGVTGIVLGATRHYRGDQRLSDEDQFGKIYKELKADLDERILVKTLKFSKHNLKREKSGCLAKSSFKINKSIDFDTLLHLIKQFTEILKLKPTFSLNKVTQISGKRSNEVLVKAIADQLKEEIFAAYKAGSDFNVDFCNKNFESYNDATTYTLQFDDGEKLDLEGQPMLPHIIETIRREGRLLDTDSTEFKHSVLYQQLITTDENNTVLTSGTVFQHIHGEISSLGNSYFLVDQEWYQIDSSFIKELNSECSDLLERVWDNKLIDETFDTTKTEGAFNLQFVGKPSWLVFDTIIPNKIELCDVFQFDGSNIHLIHVKKGFDNSIRDLASQIIISAKRIRSDIRDKFSYIDEIEKKTKSGLKSKSEAKKRLGGQIFPAGGLKGIFKTVSEKNIVFCLAFADTAVKKRTLKKDIKDFNSNIAKYMLIQLHREIKTLGFDFKVIQLDK